MKYHIVATWPKTRELKSYLTELEHAVKEGLDINFRVANLPKWPSRIPGYQPRCYMVHDGYIRGFNEIVTTRYSHGNDISYVKDDSWAGFWPAGYYIVRNPKWHHIFPVKMKGFQGWRWHEDPACLGELVLD
jgi:hypothetical protein